MNILITGAKGRLGSQLSALLEPSDHTVTGFDIDEVDIRRRDQVRQVFDAARPDVVLHCAALTAVDYCAEHPDEALEVNGYGTQTLALECQARGAALLYVSTNEVFDGKARHDYQEYDPPNPPNAYGYSKWVGEQMVRDVVQRFYIVRTAWLFAHGGRNFIQVVLQRANQGQPLRVVTNEIGSPTYTTDLAGAILWLIQTEHYGVYHLVNDGRTSRYAFARHVLDQAGYRDTVIEPIALAEFQRASRPPEYSVLRNVAAARLGITLRPWQDAVTAFLAAEGLLRQQG